MDRFVNIFLGLASVCLGVMIIKRPVYYHNQWQQIIDLSGFNVPFGCVLIIWGIAFLYLEFRKKTK